MLCRERESNSHGLPRTILSRVRLPIPSPRHFFYFVYSVYTDYFVSVTYFLRNIFLSRPPAGFRHLRRSSLLDTSASFLVESLAIYLWPSHEFANSHHRSSSSRPKVCWLFDIFAADLAKSCLGTEAVSGRKLGSCSTSSRPSRLENYTLFVHFTKVKICSSIKFFQNVLEDCIITWKGKWVTQKLVLPQISLHSLLEAIAQIQPSGNEMPMTGLIALKVKVEFLYPENTVSFTSIHHARTEAIALGFVVHQDYKHSLTSTGKQKLRELEAAKTPKRTTAKTKWHHSFLDSKKIPGPLWSGFPLRK